MIHRIILLITIFFLSFGCSGGNELLTEKPALGQGMTSEIAVEVSPKKPIKTDLIVARVSGAGGYIQYRWLLNGTEIEDAEEPRLRYDNLKKGDRIQVKVVAGKKAILSRPVFVQNSPPRIVSSRLLPLAPKKGDKIRAVVSAADTGGDEVSFEYEWSLNGMILPQIKGDSIDLDFVRRDRIVVKITPYNKDERGTPITQGVVVGNSYPVISTKIDDAFIKNDRCQARIAASDLNGDTLTFSLKKAPQGMTIDSTSGTITWDFKSDKTVKHDLTVSVRDTEGAETELNLSMEGCFPNS